MATPKKVKTITINSTKYQVGGGAGAVFADIAYNSEDGYWEVSTVVDGDGNALTAAQVAENVKLGAPVYVKDVDEGRYILMTDMAEDTYGIYMYGTSGILGFDNKRYNFSINGGVSFGGSKVVQYAAFEDSAASPSVGDSVTLTGRLPSNVDEGYNPVLKIKDGSGHNNECVFLFKMNQAFGTGTKGYYFAAIIGGNKKLIGVKDANDVYTIGSIEALV